MKRFLWLLFFVLCFITACSKKSEETFEEQLKLGQKYLEEMKYEEAIVAFSKAIDLEPESADAYLGRGQAYIEMAEQFKEQDTETFIKYYEQAADDYESVQEMEPESRSIREQLITIYKELGEEDKIADLDAAAESVSENDAAETKESYDNRAELEISTKILDDLLKLLETEDHSAIFEIMESEEFQEIMEAVDDFGEPMLMVEDSFGLGLYPVSTEYLGDCMLYYGAYQKELRHGNGLWLGYHDGNRYLAKGNWIQDLPNGQQTVKEWFSGLSSDVEILKKSGRVQNGRWNGNVSWNYERDNGDIDQFLVCFADGSWVVLDTRTENGTFEYVLAKNGETIRGGKKNSDARLTTEDISGSYGIEGFLR